VRRLLLASALIAPPLAANATYTSTFIFAPNDPLHGFCTTVSCGDINSGGNTVTGNTTTGFDGTHFRFTISPGPQTGGFFLVIAEPNNVSAVVPSVTGTINTVSIGTVTGTARGAWTTGDLDKQANIAALFPGASPTNPIDNFLSFTKANQPSATGYNLFSLSFGSLQVQDDSAAGKAAMDLLDTNLPMGSMIFGVFDSGQDGKGNEVWIATASSGVLWDNTNDDPPPPRDSIPEPASLVLLSTGLIGLGFIRSRRS
jgi:hypothetical protein